MLGGFREGAHGRAWDVSSLPGGREGPGSKWSPQPSPAPKSRELWVAPMAGSFLSAHLQIWSKTHQGMLHPGMGPQQQAPYPGWLSADPGKHHLVIRGEVPTL